MNNRLRARWRYLGLVVCALLLLSCRPSPQRAYEQGITAAQSGDWAAAAKAFGAAGDFADAPARAAEALTLISDVDSQYDLARQASRERRWFDAYAALKTALELDPDYEAARRDLSRATGELEKILGQAEARLQADDPEAAAALYAQAGTYRQADRRAQAAHKLAGELGALYTQMTIAAAEQDWATALRQCAQLCGRAPAYRDASKLRASYLRQAYRAAEQALADGHATEALHLLNAITAVDPAYEDARHLLQEAQTGAMDDLVGVYEYNRLVGRHRGLELRLDAVEVRPDGELLARATVSNISSMRNHLECPQNGDGPPTIQLLPDNGAQALPRQWACQQWAAQEWDLAAGGSMSFWWLYPAPDDLTATFTLTFEPWGQVDVSLLEQ